MRVLLLTTCDMASPRMADFERLTESLVATSATSPHDITHVVLMQRASQSELAQRITPATGFKQIILSTPKRLSISAARNVMLALAQERQLLQQADWVAFPDDDAWYPPGVVDLISTVFAAEPPVDLVTCQYSQKPFTSAQAPAFQWRTDLFRLVTVFSSNTIFVRRSALEAAGVFFDERLGLGAPINGGEDLDFALRATASGRPIAYCAAPLVGHRDRLQWVRSRYFQGSVCALARSAAVTRHFRLAGLRKLLVGVYLVLKRELPLREFTSALRLARRFYAGPTALHHPASSAEQVEELARAEPA